MGDDGATDFRADPMESPDGHGLARRAWKTYVRKSNDWLGPALRPLLEPGVRKVAASGVVDLLGFWLVWHLQGGYEGLRALGMSRSAIYRRIKLFRSLTGMHPDEYVLPGVSISLDEYRSTKPYRREA